MKRQNQQGLAAQLLAAALMGAVAFALVFVITGAPGPGLDPDALQYMGAAQAVAMHGQYRVPKAKWTSPDSTEALAHFPPGYPTALALPVRLGMTPTQAARLVQATSAFVTIATVVFLVSAAATPMAAILLTFALFAMTSMHEVHVSVLSEPLYLACMMLALAAMVHAPERPLRSGIPAAIGVMTRYAGASIVGAAALWQLMQNGSWFDRARRATMALLPALVLQGAWIVRTRMAAGPGEIRKVAFYGELGPTIAQGLATFTAWLIPDAGALRDPIPHRGALAAIAGTALLMLVLIGTWRIATAARRAAPRVGSFVGRSALERDDARELMAWRLMTASTLLVVCYLGMVMASRMFADPEIPLDERILSPALLLLAIIGTVGLARWWRGTHLRVARLVVGAALLTWWLGSAAATLAEARYALTWGSDFAGKQWHDSELLAWARADGAHTPLYSNWPAVVYFYLHRPSHELPMSMDSDSTTLQAFADTVRVHNGRVLLFGVQTGEFTPSEMLVRLPGFKEVARLADGVVLGPDVPVPPQP
ncbi:MAG: hypothetical protein ABJE47_10665 [bacterium]